MKRFFIFLLLCLVLMAGAWFGRSILPPPPAWELPQDTVIVTEEVEKVVYKDKEAVIKLDSLYITDTNMIDSMLSIIDMKEDTIIVLMNYLESMTQSDSTQLIAEHDTTVSFGGASWDQYTSYNYGKRSFNFEYDNMNVPVKSVPRGTILNDFGITIGATSSKHLWYGINYNWVSVGMSTDNTFYLGLHITWDNIKELIGGLKK